MNKRKPIRLSPAAAWYHEWLSLNHEPGETIGCSVYVEDMIGELIAAGVLERVGPRRCRLLKTYGEVEV